MFPKAWNMRSGGRPDLPEHMLVTYSLIRRMILKMVQTRPDTGAKTQTDGLVLHCEEPMIQSVQGHNWPYSSAVPASDLRGDRARRSSGSKAGGFRSLPNAVSRGTNTHTHKHTHTRAPEHPHGRSLSAHHS